jgi:hypothetical protein
MYTVGAALANPNTTHEGREHATHELHSMVRLASEILKSIMADK